MARRAQRRSMTSVRRQSCSYSDRGNPNQLSALPSNRVIALIRSAARVSTRRPAPWQIPPVWARKGAPLGPAGWSGQHRLTGRTLGTRATATGAVAPRARSAGADHRRTWDGPDGERRVGYSVRTWRAVHRRTARRVRETVRETRVRETSVGEPSVRETRREVPLAGSKQPTHLAETAALHDQAMSGTRVVRRPPSTQDIIVARWAG